jgi:hypothetical protein
MVLGIEVIKLFAANIAILVYIGSTPSTKPVDPDPAQPPTIPGARRSHRMSTWRFSSDSMKRDSNSLSQR